MGFPGASEVKASAWNVGDPGSIPELGSNVGDPGSIPWRRKWQPTPVLLPGMNMYFHYSVCTLEGILELSRKPQKNTNA